MARWGLDHPGVGGGELGRVPQAGADSGGDRGEVHEVDGGSLTG